jgi:hypothetical protein
MKKGVAGVRLCDMSGCYDRWPCVRHGTLAYSSWQADGWAGGVRVTADTRREFLEPSPCRCGYILCSCPPKALQGPLQRLDDWDPIMRKWLGEVRTLLDEVAPAPAPDAPDFCLGEHVQVTTTTGTVAEGTVLGVTQFHICLLYDDGGTWWFNRRQVKHVPLESAEAPKGAIPLAGWDFQDAGGMGGYYRNPTMPHGYDVVVEYNAGWACLKGERFWPQPLEAMVDAEAAARRNQAEVLEYYAADEDPPEDDNDD